MGPYMESGEITQMLTNQMYQNGMSDQAVIGNGVVMIVNVGLVEKTTLEAVSEETETSSTENVGISTEEATATTENFFSVANDTDDGADMVDTNEFSDVVDSIEDATTSVEAVEETMPPTVVNADSLFDLPETESTANAQSFDGEEEEEIVQPNEEAESVVDSSENAAQSPENLSADSDETSDEVDAIAPSTVSSESTIDEQDSVGTDVEGSTATVDDSEETGSIATVDGESDEEDSPTAGDIVSNEENATVSVTNVDSTIISEGIAAEDEAEAVEETLADSEAEEVNFEEETLGDTTSTEDTTLNEIISDEEPEKADLSQSKEDDKDTNSDTADADVILSDKESTAEPASNPTAAPTTKPTSCVVCELTLNSIIRIQLDNVNEKLDDDSKRKFEEVCTSFLDEQLGIATPPITDLNCVLVEESFESESRALRRKLSDMYLADVDVTGMALSTPSHQTAESIKFKQLCVGTFTVQGFLFVRALKEADEGVFGGVQNARGVMTYDSSEALDGGEDIGDPTDPDAGWLSTEVLAAIAAGSAFLFVSFLVFIMLKARKRRNENKSGKNLESGIYDEFPELRSSPTNSNDTGHSSASGGKHALITPVSIRSNREEVEVDMIPDSFSGDQDNARGQKISSMLNSRVRRDLVAPAGKLGIMVANTAGFVSVFDMNEYNIHIFCHTQQLSQGPAVHTMREGSPMEGLIFVNDIIIAINDINTRDFTATQITKMMKETVDQERKITVLSSVR